MTINKLNITYNHNSRILRRAFDPGKVVFAGRKRLAFRSLAFICHLYLILILIGDRYHTPLPVPQLTSLKRKCYTYRGFLIRGAGVKFQDQTYWAQCTMYIMDDLKNDVGGFITYILPPVLHDDLILTQRALRT